MSRVRQSEITAALVHSIDTGTYPDSEDVAAAELSSESLPAITKAIHEARKALEDEISQEARKISPDVDTWIKQAQQLQSDIEHSKQVAREIVRQAEEASVLREQQRDVTTKLRLLETEVDFNSRLTNTLESIKAIAGNLQIGQNAVQDEKLTSGLDQYELCRANLAELSALESTTAVELLQQRHEKLRLTLLDAAEQHWSKLIVVEHEISCIAIPTRVDGKTALGLQETVGLMARLDVLDGKISALCRSLNDLIIKPCLRLYSDGSAAKLVIGEHDIRIQGRTHQKSAQELIHDLTSILSFLARHFPPEIITRLSEILVPSLIATLISSWLNASVKTSLEFLPKHQSLLKSVAEFAAFLTESGWHGATDLMEWVDDAPKVWLARRRETSLTSVRESLTDDIGKIKIVERVETQMIAKDDIIAPQNGSADEWDAWAEEGAGEASDQQPTDPPVAEDMSAWDDDVGDSPSEPKTDAALVAAEQANGAEDDNVEEAWGWNEQDSDAQHDIVESSVHESKHNGNSEENKTVERELTLKETYTVTGVPDDLLEMIAHIISDAAELRQPQFEDSAVAPAAAAMYSIPTIVLAGFRALAPTYYDAIEGGNMYLYNDSLRLTSELTSLLSRQAAEDATSGLSQSAWPSTRMKLDTDIEALSSFSKRAYGKEMESQRTILGDLLDGAQGFTNCTESPFAAECENAVSMTIDRIQEVRRQWQPILSRSALMQSLGSLIATVLNKVIVDICDLSDISEEESKRLKNLCDRFAKLSDIFAHETPDGQASDMTGMYTPNWFRFQYLGEILESSLADIKYLWQEGGLKLEFDADEVVDLVEALFAESDYRRKAIAELRRG